MYFFKQSGQIAKTKFLILSSKCYGLDRFEIGLPLKQIPDKQMFKISIKSQHANFDKITLMQQFLN